MPHLAILDLSLKIDDILKRYLKLLSENCLLREEIEKLRVEKTWLSSKNQLAVTKIKQAVSQLREEIHERIT